MSGLSMTTPALHAAAPGVPVIDPTAIAQAIQQVLILQQQYDQLIRHLNQLERTHENFTGDRGFGSTLADIRQYAFVTENIANDFDNIRNLGVAALTGEARQIYLQSSAGVRCNSLHQDLRLRCERDVAFAAYRKATWRASQKASLRHLQNINHLREMIHTATDAKGIAEVQARIANEQNALSTAKVRLDAVERELEAEEKMAELERERDIADAFAVE